MRIKQVIGLILTVLLATLFLLLGLFAVPINAQTNSTWNGGTGNWSNASDWNPAVVPNNIGVSTTYNVTISVPGSFVAMDVLNATVVDLSLGVTDTLSINSGNSLTWLFNGSNAGTLINSGTLNNGVGFGAIDNTGTIINTGTINSLQGTDFNNSGTLTNTGTFAITQGGGSENSGTLTNTGLLVFGIGTTNHNAGTIDNIGGTIQLANSSLFNSGTLNNIGGTIDGANGGVIANSGMLYNDSSSTLTIGGPGRLTNNIGGILVNAGTLTSNSKIDNGGTFNNTGTLNNGPVSIAIINNSGTLNNSGAINNTLGASLSNSGTLNNSGTINNSGTFANSGAVTISSSSQFNTSTNYTQTAGSTIVNGILTATGSAIVDIERGALGGTGTINGNVAMGGTLTSGATGTPGTLVIFGNYEQLGNGTLEELMGPVSHSFLDVSGNVTLDSGSLLDITLLNGFDPLNQTFSIMDFESRVGQFSNGPSFSDDGFIWAITYRQHEIDVTAVQPTPEPSSLLLLFIGLASLAFYVPRKMDKTQRFA